MYRRMTHDIGSYDRVILVGPVYMGRFITPLRSFVKKYLREINSLVFMTCCGSAYE